MGNHELIPQIDINPIAEQSPYLRRLIRTYRNKGLKYKFKTETTNDTPETETLRFAQNFPEGVVKNIGWIYRVSLPRPGQFELDEVTGELDKEHKIKQALIYHLNQYVTDPKLDGVKKLVGFNRTEGVYQDPIVDYKYDKDGRRVDFDIIGNVNIFYIEYTPENVTKILDEMKNAPNTMGVCIAGESGPSPWSKGPYVVHNFDEFRNIKDIDGLMAASIGVQGRGPFLKAEYGGYEEYQEWRKQKPARKYVPPKDD